MTQTFKSNQATQAIHVGSDPEPITGAVIPPLYLTSTYRQTSPGEHTGFEYSRTQNPSRFALEAVIAALEGGKKGFAFASGMAATATVLELLDSGEHVIAMDDLYGGTARLFEKVRRRSANLNFSFVDCSSTDNIEKAIQPNTRMIWLESPSNPLLKIVDIVKIAEIAKQNHALLVVDNTFATPCLQQPLALGADLVVHSATKYLNGHSDAICGLVVCGDNSDLIEQMGFLQNSAGAVIGPFDSYLVQRGIKTLPLRIEKHCDNAEQLVSWLEEHPKVSKVIYPGSSQHPHHELAKRQMRRFGGMISVELDTDLAGTFRFLEKTKLFTLAESLGGVESLIEHPAIMTHASVPAERRAQIGISDTLVRLSVGIESIEDLQMDLECAFKDL